MMSSGEDIADKHFQNTNVQGRLWSTYTQMQLQADPKLIYHL
jgi:hypothetical protein